MYDYQFLATTQLFEGASPEEIQEMLGCLGAHSREYDAGERILHMGDQINEIGLFLSHRIFHVTPKTIRGKALA